MRNLVLLTVSFATILAVAGTTAAHPDGHGVVECALASGIGTCNGESFAHQATACPTAPLDGGDLVAECVGQV